MRFNLVIEILFFSSEDGSVGDVDRFVLFQSRNRDSFLFKCIPGDGSVQPFPFQSRNRDSFLFKIDYVDSLSGRVAVIVSIS